MKRFWDKVDKTDSCWNWVAGKFASGYEQFRLNGSSVRAHRLSLELEGVDIPSDMCVCHSCDNPSCVNPDHLFLATNKENSMDMVKKGRSMAGERHASSKLSWKDVRAIRSAHKNGASRKDLVSFYPVGAAQLGRIIRHERWREPNE